MSLQSVIDDDKARVVANLTTAIRAYTASSNPLSEQTIAADFLSSRLSPASFYDAARALGYSPQQINAYALAVLTNS